MKQLEELEEKFLNEIKPLVNQFIEYKKQPLDMKQRMECVDIRKEVQSKVSEFKIIYTEMVSKEIEKKEVENTQINTQRAEKMKNLIQTRTNILSRDKAIKQSKNEGKDDVYQLLCLTQKEELEKFNKIKQECNEKQKLYKSNIRKLEKLKKAQTEFEERYGDMDYITEREVYRLDSFMGLKEESKTNRISNGQVYCEDFNEIKDFGDFIDIQEPAKEKEERDEQEAIKEKDKELEEIQEEIAQGVLDKTKQEFNEYLEQKMRELEESIDEEIKDEEKTEDELTREDNNKKNKDNSKKGKITLWQRLKSIFRKRKVPRLEEGKEKETKTKNKFASLKIGVPTEEQQAENAKKFWHRNKEKDVKTEEKHKIDEVLTLLD